MRLLDAADSAALDAADALDDGAAYEGGVLDHLLVLTDGSVRRQPPVRTWLAPRCLPASPRGASSADTGTPDGAHGRRPDPG